MTWWNIYIIVIGFSGILGIIITPIFRKLALILGFTDKPAVQEHKSHERITPLLGGVAMCTTWGLTLLLGIYSPSFLSTQFFSPLIIENLSGVFSVQPRLLSIIIGAILITMLGLVDDKFNISAKIKFSGQLAITAFVVYYGDIRISLFFLNPALSYIVTILWILLVINAINFFDNMDGLAVGVATIAFSFFAIASIIYNHNFIACLTIAGVGTTIGFWFYNHTPATIFMGDSGSHFLGYTLGVSGAITTYYQSNITVTPLSVLIPVFILAIPLFDLFSVVLIRIRIKKPIYIGDNNHISHRFTKMGMSRKNAVFAVHLLSVIVGMSVLPLLWGDELTGIICFVQACLILVLISVLQYTVIKLNNRH